jgi:hypothetical protein
MFLQINDSMSLEEVQDRFNECFPFLKIAFYSKGHKKFQASDKKYLYEGNCRIGDIRKNHYSGALEIKSWHSTAKVEMELSVLKKRKRKMKKKKGLPGKNTAFLLSPAAFLCRRM